MVKNKLVLSAFALLISCCNGDEFSNFYYMRFDLQSGNEKVSQVMVLLEDTERMNGNDILNSDKASIGLQVSAMFENPDDPNLYQSIHFYWSREIPKDDVTFGDNGIPILKDPAKMTEYLPGTNLFEEQSTDFFSYFLENTNSFCSAGVDPDYRNMFRITYARQYTDDDNKEVIDIAAEFSVRYLSFCNLGDKKISDGVLRAKIIL